MWHPETATRSKEMRRTLALLAVVLLGSSIPAIAQDSATRKAEVMTAVQKLFDGMRARDTLGLAQVLDPAARLVTTFGTSAAPDMDVTPVPAFIHIVATAEPGQLLDERIGDPVVELEDNLATVWVKYRFYIGERFSHCGVDAMQLAKTTNGWQIIALADTRRAPAECGD
jgi:hypothetical protein